jgi:hypothetical protein
MNASAKDTAEETLSFFRERIVDPLGCVLPAMSSGGVRRSTCIFSCD